MPRERDARARSLETEMACRRPFVAWRGSVLRELLELTQVVFIRGACEPTTDLRYLPIEITSPVVVADRLSLGLQVSDL